VFENAARHLVQGGRFVIELWVPDLQTLPPGGPGPGSPLVPAISAPTPSIQLLNEVVSHHVTFGREAGTAARIFRTLHRYVWPAELDLMARIAGFSLESRRGGWSDEPFTADSSDHVSPSRLS